MIIFQLKGERLEQERRRDQAERILEVISPRKLPLERILEVILSTTKKCFQKSLKKGVWGCIGCVCLCERPLLLIMILILIGDVLHSSVAVCPFWA